jgi:two-component system chemotaxis response regulator CheB
VGVILSGMGRDGVDGLAALRRAGGRIVAQEAASCAVDGMPGAAQASGLADAVLAPDAIADRLALWVRR